MPDTDDYDDEPENQDPKPNWRRKLEKDSKAAAEKAEAAETRAATAERKLAFAEAGIPLTEKWSKFFVSGYDGDLTPEAILAAAAEAGFVESPQDEIPDAEKAAHQRIAEANAGGSAPPGRNWNAEYAEAKSPEDVLRIAREKGVQVVER